jgi:serine/threonine protein kinase
MATVYLAQDLKHNRKVALKVLKPELAAVVGTERFLAEIETTANLQHPHILPLFDSGEADGFLFYVMPYVEGESLRDRLDREHQLPVDEAVRIATNVAEALDYAHAQGVIHRDIKPENILLQAGKPVVSDFGITLALGAAGGNRLTETGLSLGTPHYMSPEQATGDQHVGPATDLWALGCVLYEMLVGEPPYTGSTPQAVLGKIVTADAPSARAERKAVPSNVDAAIRRALEKLPADRFGAASHFAEALDDPSFRLPVVESGPSPGWARSTVIAAGWMGLVLVSVATVLWVLAGRGSNRTGAHFEVVLPSGLSVSRDPYPNVDVSPDGSLIVFAGSASDGRQGLWLRPVGELSPAPIEGTEEGRAPRFSPDGRSIVLPGPRPEAGSDVRRASPDGSRRRPRCSGGPGLGTGRDDLLQRSLGPRHRANEPRR